MNENTSIQPNNQSSSEVKDSNAGAVFNATLTDNEATGVNTENVNSNEWMLTDEVKGSGDKPEWFLNDKYKTVTEQAKAYKEAEKMIGNRPKSPESYEINLSEDNKGTKFKQDEGFFKEFTEIAKDSGMSQESYDKTVNGYIKFQKEQSDKFVKEFDEDSKTIFKDAGLDAEKAKDQAQIYLINNLGEEQKGFINDWLEDPYAVKAMGLLMKANNKGIPTPEFNQQTKDKQYFMNKMKDSRYTYDMNYSKTVDDEMAEAIGNGTYRK